jgi:hypothetical protein
MGEPFGMLGLDLDQSLSENGWILAPKTVFRLRRVL